MKKIIVNAPILSRSGYGEMARFALRCLRKHQDKFDIYVNVINWGATGYLFRETEEFEWINFLRMKSEQFIKQGGQFDISLQITIPNEWKRMAPMNIGYTAGIETHIISPAWLEPSNQMDKIIVISEHAKNTFLSTIFSDAQGNNFKVNTPIEVVHFPVTNVEPTKLDLDLKNDFNFLTVNQWGPRKNMEFLISNFIDEFREEEVGLVIKTNVANDSTLDKVQTEERLKNLIDSKGPKKCKVYLIHGTLTDEEMSAIYSHPKIKAFVTATHGEGFGMPIFEAACHELPVVATDWSGHLDFLTFKSTDGDNKKLFAKVDFEMKQIQPEHVWPGVMEAQAGWAFPTAGSLKSRMREVYKDYPRFKSWAKKLAVYNQEKFSEELVTKSFMDVFGPVEVQEDELIVL